MGWEFWRKQFCRLDKPLPGLSFSPLHTYVLGLPLSSAASCLISSRPPAALRVEESIYIPSPASLATLGPCPLISTSL